MINEQNIAQNKFNQSINNLNQTMASLSYATNPQNYTAVQNYEKVNTAISNKLGFINPQAISESTKQAIKTPIFLLSGKKEVYKTEDPITEFTGGFVGGVASEIKERPLDLAVIGGLSYGAGFLAEGSVIGINAISKTGGIVAQSLLSAGEIGLGASYIYSTGKEVMALPDAKSKGEFLGQQATIGAVVGYSYGSGKTGFEKVRGIYNTQGRTYLETQQGEYPQANPSKQLELFQKNIKTELSSKAGAFHTTDKAFWDKTLTANNGASEIAGLYASTQVSTPFARVSGSGKTGFNMGTIKAYIKSLYTPAGSPAIAYLTPEGYRVSPVKFSSTKLFEGQKYVTGRGYAYFSNTAKSGYADLPLIKSEIEAVFRPSGDIYGLTNTNYFTKIKGIRTPIDVFNFGGKSMPAGVTSTNIGGVSIYGGKSSYVLPQIQGSTITGLTSKSYSYTYQALPTSLPTSYALSKTTTSFQYGVSSFTPISSRKSSDRSGTSYNTSFTGVSSSLPTSSRVSSPVSKPTYYPRGSSTSNLFSSKATRNTITGIKQDKGFSSKGLGSFGVSLRRYGKFKPVGQATTLQGALSLGTYKARNTLGATFKVTGGAVSKFNTPTGFYPKFSKKEGLVFIQKRKSRLSSRGEKLEIKSAKLKF